MSSDFTYTFYQPRLARTRYLSGAFPSRLDRRFGPFIELPKSGAATRETAVSCGVLVAGFLAAFLTFCATPPVVGFCLTSSSCCAESALGGAALTFESWIFVSLDMLKQERGALRKLGMVTYPLALIPFRDIRRTVGEF
jgi:hypothetical protein